MATFAKASEPLPLKMKPLTLGVQFSSVAQLCPTLWDPMDCSTPFFPVHHQLPELAQTHIHRVGDSIQQSHPVVPYSSCLQSLAASGSFLCDESVLCIKWPKYWSFNFSIIASNEYSELISFRIDWFDLHWSKELSRVFSSTTVQKQQFFSTQPSLCPNSHIYTWLLEKQ